MPPRAHRPAARRGCQHHPGNSTRSTSRRTHRKVLLNLMRWRKCTLTGFLREENFQQSSVLSSEAGWASLRCAFCKGKGANLKSYGQCPYCGGRKVVTLREPIARCAFCAGSGRNIFQPELVCIVCRGKGAISLVPPFDTCSDCGGSGKSRGAWHLPCRCCSGKGFVHVATTHRSAAHKEVRRQSHGSNPVSE